MKIHLQMETHDPLGLAVDIAGKGNSLSAGTIVDAPGNVRVELQPIRVRRSFGIPEVLQFVLDVSITVELSLFSAWLYDKVKDRHVERIIMRRTVITEISEEKVRQALEEEIEIRK